jgi:membrane-bound metal-dependent hydrolase YbcI (DUF457 family)
VTWTTHTLFGISALWLLAPLPPEVLGYDFGTLAACAALGALLPDLDASDSKIKHLRLLGTQFKPFLLPAQIIHRSDQHRGLLHSLWGIGMAGTCTFPLAFWIGWAPVTALLLGYASHLLGDSATKSGLRLLHPNKRRYHVLPASLRITTQSQTEDLVASLLLLPVLLLFFNYLRT